LDKNEIYRVFDADGELSQRFAGYEYRDGQLEMALLIRRAYEEDAIAAIEAGTGIGKSFAYLVPALLWALEHPHERTVIATSTINLQKQLYDKDIVQLFTILKKSCPVALVMGRRNYLCLHRLEERVAEAPLLARDPLSELGALVAWSQTTDTGLRTEFPGRLRGELWADVCSDPDLCLGYRCSYSRDCFFMKSRKKAMEAKILIGNHHLLFTDARSRLIDQLSYDEESVLPPFQRLVIDEAHNIEKNATDFFTVTYSGHEMLRSIGRIAQKRRHAKGLVEELAPYAPDKNLPDDILQVIAQLVEAIGYVDTFLIGFMQQVRSFNFLVQVHMQAQLTDFIRLGQTLIGFTEILEDLVNKFLVKGVLPDELAHRGRELLVHVLRIRAGALALAQFINFEQWTEDVHWFEVNDYGKKGKGVAVHVSPLLVADSLKNSIFQGLATVVCTSATLDLNDNFAYWGSRIGLPLASDRLYLTAVHFSPFDFKKNLLLLTPNDAPIFSEKNSQDYITYVGKSVLEALLASGGGALVLFTSYKMLKEVSDALQSDLMKAGLTVLRQGDADRFQLLHQFTDDVDSVLFATDSFWEGVDAPGNTLRLVIIVKLPFRVPTDPVFRARQEALDKEGKSGFFTLALPEATMKLKQGFGRLLRNTVDTGIVLILDSRVVNKQYGRWMLQALPQSFHPETTSDGVPTKIESFLYG
jgi:ATP-dependent DNA helicase DinG